jgi:hypothetical protein
MKRPLRWLFRAASAAISALLALAGCGNSSRPDPAPPGPNIHWRGQDSGYRHDSEEGSASQPDHPATK